jgi:hypothetical protein
MKIRHLTVGEPQRICTVSFPSQSVGSSADILLTLLLMHESIPKVSKHPTNCSHRLRGVMLSTSTRQYIHVTRCSRLSGLPFDARDQARIH